MESDLSFLLDPSPDEWYDSSKSQLLFQEIFPCVGLLDEAKQLENIIKHFICRECIKEHPSDEGYLGWARVMWGHRLDQLFLENKKNLDQLSYRLLRVSEQGLAFELYHRLVARESTFEELSILYGVGKERFNGGFFDVQDVERLPDGLAKILLKFDIGQISKPISINDQYAVFELVDFVSAVRGPALDKRLLERQFQLWLSGMSDHLRIQLNC